MDDAQRRFQRIAVLKGGPSPEREVSLASGGAVAEALREAGYDVEEVDVKEPRLDLPEKIEAAFVALHGTFGEDGQVQALLNRAGVPYTGPGAEASRKAFDKRITKELLFQQGILTAPYEMLSANYDIRSLPIPLVVKPPLMGSSVGISLVFSESEWDDAIAEGLKFGEEAMVEMYISGRELTVGIVGEEALPIVEIVAPEGNFDYRAKYTKGVTTYVCPADLPERIATECREVALQVHRLLGCRGMSRVDFRLADDGQAFVLELNTIPGFTETSLLPKAAKAAGINFPDLCSRILNTAMID